MRAYALASLLAACLLAEAPAAAQTGVFLPQSPIGPGGEDSIETAEGTRCRQSMNGNGAYADLGVVGNSQRRGDRGQALVVGSQDDYALAYARVTIPLGRKPARLDCTKLYDLEIARLKREIELLKMAPE